MNITGVTEEQFVNVVTKVSWQRYGGNVSTIDMRPASGRSCRGRVNVKSSSGLGARRSWSGRRGPWACWHVFRDVIAEVFEQYPDARVSTGMARYTRANWAHTYPQTGDRNIGSMVNPVTMPELCDCSDEIRGDDF